MALEDPSGDSDFDGALDTQIGVMDLETVDKNLREQFNITLDDFYGASDLPDLVTERLQRRRLRDRIKRAVQRVSKSLSLCYNVKLTRIKT